MSHHHLAHFSLLSTYWLLQKAQVKLESQTFSHTCNWMISRKLWIKNWNLQDGLLIKKNTQALLVAQEENIKRPLLWPTRIKKRKWVQYPRGLYLVERYSWRKADLKRQLKWRSNKPTSLCAVSNDFTLFRDYQLMSEEVIKEST